ncbi:hypothetical protein FA10DRAFT_298450 [Acaromyces ingoldii]|uniref:Transport protein particle component n=1 Tax=Acaromyces ingoldii TaxID=215250 RepID=A0A316YWG1_9BASI|nr:hypothetical protein FA10DRAFT_298450 [Acaromyces ingoldii]PWN93008.1 hypothetical protein FA10DRAFT_298450 [Acaromyces ingoldii]
MAAKAQPQRVSLGQSATVPGHTLPSSAGSGQATAPQQQQQQQQQHQQASSSSSSSASSSSILNSTSLALALPHSQQCSPVTHVDSNALQYLAMEMAPVLRKSARVALRRRQSGLAQLVEAGLVPSTSSSSSKTPPASELEDETVARLEAIGAHVGSAFAERLSRDRPPFSATLDVVKFVCKDVWTACFDKQVDNLRTNHRGVYVLQDNHFRPLLRLSTTMAAGPGALAPATRLHLAYPSGVIRGALARLGVPATVVAETSQVPQCTFHVKTAAQR